MNTDPVTQVLDGREEGLEGVVRALTNSVDPIVLYGAGATARRVYADLRKRGIEFHAVAVDRVPDSGSTFGEHPLVSVADLARSGRSFHFLLGFVPIADSVAAIAQRLQAQVGGRLTAPDFSGYSFGVATPAFVQEHANDLRDFSDSLADELSRRTLVAYVKARMTFNGEYVDEVYRPDQYFPSDIVRLSGDEHFIDAGAYDGDTLAQFARTTSRRYASIRAFEPDPVTFLRLQRTVQELDLPRCELRNAGTWEYTGELAFRAADERLSGLDDAGEARVRVEAIDDVIGEAPVSFIKMDVEGAELSSLKGARATIERNRPRLAVCLYHRLDDLVTIPAWIRKVLPGARLFLRVHTRHSQELVLYAIP